MNTDYQPAVQIRQGWRRGFSGARASLNSHTSWLLIAGGLALLLNLVAGALKARGLPLPDRGRYAVVYTPIALAPTLLSFGLRDLMIRRRDAQKLVDALAIAVFIGLLLVPCAYLLAPHLARGDGDITFWLRVGFAGLPAALTIEVLLGAALARGRLRVLAIATLGPSVFNVLSTIALFALGDGTLTFDQICLWLVVGNIVGCVPAVLVVRHTDLGHISPMPTLGQTVALAFKVWVGALGLLLMSRLDHLIFTQTVSRTSLAAYVVVSPLSLLPHLPGSVVMQRSSAAIAEGRVSAWQAVLRVGAVTTPACAVLGAAGYPLIVAIYGERYGDAYPLFLGQLLAVAASSYFTAAATTYLWSGAIRWAAVSVSIALVVASVSLIIGSALWGAVAGGPAVALGYTVGGIVLAIHGRRQTKDARHAH